MLVLNISHGRSCTLIETITRMDLELRQIASVLDEGDVHGELLDSMTAQVAELAGRKAFIIGLLRECTVAAEDGFLPNDKTA